MKTVCMLNKCNGCMVCIDNCPKHCISIIDDMEVLNAFIDENECINCGCCKKICPNVNLPKRSEPIEWKQGWTITKLRENASSGGAASAFINTFIRSGGYVASCLFEQGEFLFKITNLETEAKRFAGSKYVKSNPRGIYKEIAKYLSSNKVLFIGLPCQVAALKNYIGDTRQLYTVDLICHGTPSIKLLDLFLKEHGLNIKEIEDIKFRIKTDMGLRVDGKKITSDRVIDEYLCAFLESINYTENCYSCKFASQKRVSDITIGDSWGTEYHSEEKNGVSLILVQTSKGQELLYNSKLELKTVDVCKAIHNNHQLIHPSILTSRRERFFRYLKRGTSFKKAIFYVAPRLIVKQIIKKLFIKSHAIRSL